MSEVIRVDFKNKKRLPQMPKTRGECSGVPRPCPYKTCRYNIKGKKFSCVLDAVDANPEGMTLEDVGVEFGVTRERIRQIENKAMKTIKRKSDMNSTSVEGYTELAGK